MSCCGGRRYTVSPPPAPSVRVSPAKTDYFEYVGATGMTVFGGATGRRYRFDYPGARQAVDPRDTPSMLPVPRLRRVEAL